MGRFSTVVILLLAACGDNLDGGDELDPTQIEGLDQIEGRGVGTTTQRFVPQVCGSQTWTTNITGEAMNVSVAMNGQASVVLATPRKGGTLVGFVVDPATHVMTDDKLTIGGAFTSVTATVIANRVASTAVADSTILLHTLDLDLTNSQYVTKLAGRQLAEPALYAAGGEELVMPVGGDDGVWLHRFADSFEPISKTHLLDSAPVTALTAAVTGSNMLTAWSTDSDCYVMASNMFTAGTTARLDMACGEPRLAVNASGQGVVVFETSAGANMMTVGPSQFGGNVSMLRTGTAAPRTVFDGTSFWVSFLDERGDIIVGMLDGANRLTTMSLAGPRPTAGAYDLVMGDGSPWVVALDDTGEFSAYRMCVGVQ
jgi:hypothetical protein